MKKNILLNILILVGAVEISTGQQETRESVQELRKAGKPGKVHNYLDRMSGFWKVRGFYRINPQANPEMLSGKAKYKWILGERFLQQDFDGQKLDLPLKGLGLLGYDSLRNEVTAIWCDNSNTGIAELKGRFVDGGKKIDFRCYQTNLKNGERQQARAEIVFEGANSFRYSMFLVAEGGSEVEMLQMKYRK